MEWVKRYIGLEYQDRGRGPRYDCWGLNQKVLRERFGVDVPSYAENYPTSTDSEEIGRLVRGESLGWTEVGLSQARPGDVILFRLTGQPCHAGVVVEPPYFIHILKGCNSVIEKWDAAIWEKRVSGIFRYPALVARQDSLVVHGQRLK